ncbi:GAL1 Galactokinase [Candida maltosa Xu316]
MSISTVEDLSFYSNVEPNQQRFTEVVKTFQTNFPGDDITFFARSPGRVNLIGDHIDYNFFPVLPMAIANDVIAAVNVNSTNEIIITNTDAKDFPKEVITLSNSQIDQEHHKRGVTSLKGMKLTFNGNVPTGGGLSSSAAFCVASTLAIIRANGITDLTKQEFNKNHRCLGTLRW